MNFSEIINTYNIKTGLAGPLTCLLLQFDVYVYVKIKCHFMGTITKLFYVLNEFPNMMCTTVVFFYLFWNKKYIQFKNTLSGTTYIHTCYYSLVCMFICYIKCHFMGTITVLYEFPNKMCITVVFSLL